MKAFAAFLLAALALLIAAPAQAREEIRRFDVLIDVQRDGDVIVTETIQVNVEGMEIRRGIFRDLPRYYDLNGERLLYDYDIQSIERDGRREPYDTEAEGNAFRIVIGDEDVLLEHGAHTYVIRYRAKNQVRYFDDYDEIYWNATGNYWRLPIAEARATIVLPSGARILQHSGYTGASGGKGDAYRYRVEGERHIFETTQPLGVEQGLTVALGFAKGLIDPPSAADARALMWQRYGALGVLFLSFGALFVFLYRGFQSVGRDPLKGPVFPRYEPPTGISPAAAHHIYYRALSGHRALIATLMNLAVKGRLHIDAADKKQTTLTRTPGQAATPDLTPEDLTLETSVFGGAATKVLGEKYDSGFTAAYQSFRTKLGQRYGSPYFRWNAGYTIVAMVASVAAIVLAAILTVNWTVWHTLALIALAGLNAAFMYLMPAPTEKGQQVRTEIEGFRLYMETAEKLQLNAVEVGSAAPPPMTKERYETFLPYAVALGVEEPWTTHFERLIPEEAANYRPAWSNMSGSNALRGMSGALVANMSSGVTSAMPQSSSSSGSGGGGSSGGGGGGGGGGGW
ncbi:MAG: DUF2207 domain-containing protein [Hyphomonadaceae bacterium]